MSNLENLGASLKAISERLTDAEKHALKQAEWHFADVHPSELWECAMWEYARESTSLRFLAEKFEPFRERHRAKVEGKWRRWYGGNCNPRLEWREEKRGECSVHVLYLTGTPDSLGVGSDRVQHPVLAIVGYFKKLSDGSLALESAPAEIPNSTLMWTLNAPFESSGEVGSYEEGRQVVERTVAGWFKWLECRAGLTSMPPSIAEYIQEEMDTFIEQFPQCCEEELRLENDPSKEAAEGGVEAQAGLQRDWRILLPKVLQTPLGRFLFRVEGFPHRPWQELDARARQLAREAHVCVEPSWIAEIPHKIATHSTDGGLTNEQEFKNAHWVVLKIEWARASNRELGQAFEDWVRERRRSMGDGGKAPGAAGKGKGTEAVARLRSLAIARLWRIAGSCERAWLLQEYLRASVEERRFHALLSEPISITAPESRVRELAACCEQFFHEALGPVVPHEERPLCRTASAAIS